jgi:undecaprenyl-diphosphooligosaccharide---protein glycotransferase
MKKIAFINNTWLFVAVLLACFVFSAGVRYQQFETWKQTPAAYFVGESPMMTTLDAPYWLRLAREYNEGIYGQKGALADYPKNTETFQDRTIPQKFRDPPKIFSTSSSSSQPSTSGAREINIRNIPLLSSIIALLAPFFNYNYYLTGTLLIPVLASLFILPLGIYFFRIGVPASGLLGGLIGTFASGYYMRSSIGRIDTDMLNLFFPVLAGLLILLAGKAKKEMNVLFYSIGAGLSLFFFQWWYGRAGFILAYFIVLVFSLFVQRIRFRTILVGAFLFVLCAQPKIFMSGSDKVQDFWKSYFSIEDAREVVIENGTTPASFPNTMTTISEVDHVPMDEVLRRVLSDTTLDWIGFLWFFMVAIFKWRVLLPLVPMLALGLLSFQSSNRFIMYLAPFIGIGLGWVLHIMIETIFLLITKNICRVDLEEGTKNTKDPSTVQFSHSKTQRRKNAEEEKGEKGKRKDGNITEAEFGATTTSYLNWGRQIILYGGMVVSFWLISGQTAISFVPGPSIHTGLYATFLEAKKRVPEDAVLLTWWDYGHTLLDIGFATFHDGGTQFSPKTYFIARSLISPDQDELYDITQYLATEGTRGIAENNTSPEALMTAVRNPTIKPWDPIYLFFTADMTGKYGAISKLGSWDIVKGGSKPRGYQNMACNKITNEEMNCSGAKIDLKAGKINNQVALKRMVFIRDGKVLREQEYNHAQGYTLQLLVAGQRIVEVQLIDEVIFRSNYNQMFLLGRYRKDLYEETYNAFPFSRLFKVKF